MQKTRLSKIRRTLSWCVPLTLTALALALAAAWARGEAEIHRLSELLLAGDIDDSRSVLRDLGSPLFHGQDVRTARFVVRAFEDELPLPERLGFEVRAAQLDPSAFDLTLLARAAFARGDFDSVLRLTDLATALGPEVPELVTLAARIETGEVIAEPALYRAATSTWRGESVLARRVAEHLRAPESGVSLRFRDGEALGQLNAGGLKLADGLDPQLIPAILGDAADGVGAHTLHTTLDRELSEAARRAFGRFRGSIVLVDPWNGDVLAAVSDRKTLRREGGTPAFEQMREPASISKLITTAAYLRDGGDPDARLRRMACRGHLSYSGQRLYCPVIAGPLRGLDRAMAVSCNVAFAELATEIGRPALLGELRRFGFDRPFRASAGIRFPAGRVVTAGGDQRQLADLAIGLEASDITPLHAALLAAVVANGGELPEPALVRAADGRLGLHPRPLDAAPNRTVLDPAHADVLRQSMRAVAERGTGMRMKTRGFPVAMKTGTASHPAHGFHVNYIGFGPLPHARVAFCVRITHQGTSRRVRSAATQVTTRLLRNLRTVARQRGWLEPRQPQLAPDLRQRLARDHRRPQDGHGSTSRAR
ncbi:MAG: penicillin-binding transpeptidase domain-containing protein [Acidobacteriota bacterium]